ncbi:hypothetical protein G3I76_60730, partial [Streptomyces sp. SID11233]|nr:hypothetical protein [Streptomyces sp. SID11233]
EAEQLRRDKDQAVAAEQYERATELRDKLGELERRIESSGDPHPNKDTIAEVTVDDIAGVVSRQTGIPVSSLTQ